MLSTKVSFVKNSKDGREMVKVDNYLYQLEQINQHDGKLVWKCDQCIVRLHTKNDQVVQCFGNHNHNAPTTTTTNGLQKLSTSSTSSTSKQQPRQNSHCTKLEITELELLPNFGTINGFDSENDCQNDSLASNTTQQHNSFLIKMILAPEYRFVLAKNGSGLEQFLLYDSAELSQLEPPSPPPPGQRLMIFCTETNMNILEQTKHWLCDCSLQPYSYANQLGHLHVVTFHALDQDRIRPLVYVLMSSDCIELYHYLFDRLKLLRLSLSPRSIVFVGARVDLALVDTFQMIFPETIENVTLNHHNHCLKLKLQQLSPKIGDRYRWDLYYRFRVKMMAALAFVPVDLVEQAFEQLINDSQYSDIELELINYYDYVWIRGEPISREERKPALYPPSTWNCYNSIRQRLPVYRPHLLQAWHDRIMLYMTSGISNIGQRKQQPSKLICKCIDALRLDEKYSLNQNLSETSQTADHHNHVGANSQGLGDSEKVAQLLQKLVDSFESEFSDLSIVDYLKQISFCI